MYSLMNFQHEISHRTSIQIKKQNTTMRVGFKHNEDPMVLNCVPKMIC